MVGKYKNQLPYEACLVNKKFLASTINEVYGQAPWLSESFDLTNELNEFVGKFLLNRSSNLPNFWITKPTNMTRSIDMSVSENLDLVLRMGETGPKIASKYI